MKTIILLLFAILTIQAQTYMPKYLDFDSLHIDLPKGPEEFLDSNLIDFKQFALDSGKICKKDGILISERKAAEYIFYKAGYERQNKELQIVKYLMKDYYDKSYSVEKEYQSEIAKLQKDVKRSWLENNIGYLGFILGLATAIITEYAVIQTAK